MGSIRTEKSWERFLLSPPPPLELPTPTSPIFHLSADIRFGEKKIVPIDINLFPAGWQNLCKEDYHSALLAIREFLKVLGIKPKKILILSETFTRNPPYGENLKVLKEILSGIPAEVRIGILDPRIPEEGVFYSTLTEPILVERVIRDGENLKVGSSFYPDWIVSENDFSSGIPEELQNLSIPIDNSPYLGWWQRKKSQFYHYYFALLKEKLPSIGIDPEPFLLNYATLPFPPHDPPWEDLKNLCYELWEKIKEARKKENISSPPFLVIKDESGTFGIGLVTVENPDLLKDLPRWIREKLRRGKGGKPITHLLIQEGIQTELKWDSYPAEVVGMGVGMKAVGGFIRLHRKRSERESLNVPGMEFYPLCSHTLKTPSLSPLSPPTILQWISFLYPFIALSATMEKNKVVPLLPTPPAP